jgi:chorismate mutase
MSRLNADPLVLELRERISDIDETILEKVNERIELVERLRRHKQAQGYPFVDRSREDWVVARLTGLNGGPLSQEGVRELFTMLIDLVKREVTAQARVAGSSSLSRNPPGSRPRGTS